MNGERGYLAESITMRSAEQKPCKWRQAMRSREPDQDVGRRWEGMARRGGCGERGKGEEGGWMYGEGRDEVDRQGEERGRGKAGRLTRRQKG